MTVCAAKTRGGGTCGQRSGWGTDHVGEGRCKLHGGKSSGPPIKTGRYSLKHRASLNEKAERFLNDPSPGDLTGELALLRAMLQDYLERFPEEMPLSLDTIQQVSGMIENVGRNVERISRILNATALNQAEVKLLQARLVDLALKYVDDSKRDGFFAELGAAFAGNSGGGGVSRELTGGG